MYRSSKRYLTQPSGVYIMRFSDYSTLAVGQSVAVSRFGRRYIHNEGVYTVAKVNKVKVILARDTDGYVRTFSVKTRKELGSNVYKYLETFIESVSDMTAREEKYQKERDVRNMWAELEQAARDKKLDTMKDLIAKLEQSALL